MIVCAHGDVTEYCSRYGMVICDTWEGDLESYSGACKVLVTDQVMAEGRYYYLKNKLLIHGLELVSVWYMDDPEVVGQFIKDAESRKQRYGVRQKFGYRKVDGVVVEDPEAMAVVRRVLGLRDQGLSYRQIREDERVRYSDGRQLGVTTIMQICKNRSEYEV